jgi:hypothetical protein
LPTTRRASASIDSSCGTLVVRQFGEEPLGNGILDALAVPHAALVAAAELEAEGDSFEASRYRSISVERARKVFH